MLQQTQVERVIEKYSQFIRTFPNFTALEKAPLRKLLALWQGMGYNRRALSLRTLAQQVVKEHRGRLPSAPEELVRLPGIGNYTAGAVAAFAFNKPVVFLDTNIRRVFIHEFFQDREDVRDEEIVPCVEKTLDRTEPGKWYNALMDYGAMLKTRGANPNRRSAHYTRQSTFEGSNRQVRGMILKTLVGAKGLSAPQIARMTGAEPERVKKNLLQMANEGFIRKNGKVYSIGRG